MRHLLSKLAPFAIVLGVCTFITLLIKTGGTSVVPGLILWGIGLCFYFLPTAIAMMREKRNRIPILALNLFLGWTLVGWVVALVWALMAEDRPRRAPTLQAAP